MNTFKIKFGIGLIILLGVYLVSQGIYRRNIAVLHTYTNDSIDIAEHMHTAEIFHSAMHEMLISASRYHDTRDEAFEEQYRKQAESADNALQKLKYHGGHAAVVDNNWGSDRDVINIITEYFALFRKSIADNVFSRPDKKKADLTEAHSLFDEIFQNYYLELHRHHSARLVALQAKAHDIEARMNVYFVAQFVFALVIGIAVLFYFDRAVLKLYAVTEQLSIKDALTSLYNRRYLEKYFDGEVARSLRYGHLLSVAMIDIDDFKKYNDSHGHQAGDKLLKDVSLILAGNARGIDRVIRYGGEEFLIVFPETGKSTAITAAERIRRGIEEHTFILPNKKQGPSVTVSIGVASFPDEGSTAGEVVKKADEMLYLAKNAGKNIVKTEQLQDEPRAHRLV
ncbi:MAG: GGDEF domain-containing protein [Nitrospiraceae bacterium]|nr:GGDEF domain-containing protein [Nitrospiraceae bacterium]